MACVIFHQLFFVLSNVKDSDATVVQSELDQVVHGIHTINFKKGNIKTPPADVGIVIEGVDVLHDLENIAFACALLMGVIYALDLQLFPRTESLF